MDKQKGIKFDPNDVRVLKVFGAAMWHDNVQIVGNRQALKEIRDHIDELLSTTEEDLKQKDVPSTSSSIMVTEDDGEGYSLEIALLDQNFGGEDWNNLPVHYNDDMARDRDPKKWGNLFDIFED